MHVYILRITASYNHFNRNIIMAISNGVRIPVVGVTLVLPLLVPHRISFIPLASFKMVSDNVNNKYIIIMKFIMINSSNNINYMNQ